MNIAEVVDRDAERKKAFRKSTAVKEIKLAQQVVWGKTAAGDYHNVYGSLKPVTKEDPLRGLFSNGAATHGNPLISRSSLELLPGVRSFDPRVLDFQRELSHLLNKELPVDLDDDLFTRTGVHANFDRLRCPAGYFQSPMSYTTVDNSEYRKELGLTPGYSERQKKIAEEFWSLIWSEANMSPVNVAKLSTGGMRRFTSDAQWKLDYAMWLLQPGRFETMLNAVEKEDWLTLANEFETVYATYIQKRGQVDAPGKVRTVFDLEYALSGGKKGKAFPADKHVVIDGRSYDDFSAIRARVVHAGPWVINCFLQIMSSCAMKSMFDRFPGTFHVNTAEEISSVVDGKYIFCSDVTEFDRSMSRDAIDLVHEVCLRFWDERLVKASKRLFHSPYYARPLGLEGNKGTWVMNPCDWSSEVFAGNRSGHAWTSLIAKGNKVCETLFIIDRMYPVLGRVDQFLKGKMPMGLVNNGDDEIVWATEAKDVDRFKELRKDLSIGHYVVSPEAGQVFSGLMLTRPDPKVPKYIPMSRLQTTFEKLWVPERSIGGMHRQFWPIGVMERVSNIMTTDVGRAAWEVHMHVYKRRMEPFFGSFTDILVTAAATIDLDPNSLNEKDKAVLEDPTKLHYLYTQDEISDGVLAKVTAKLPLEVSEHFLKQYYRGHVK